MHVRWWRMGIVLEWEAQPHTWSLHVRAKTEKKARSLVAYRVAADYPGAPHLVHTCEPSDPLLKVANEERIAADFGPYKRSWNDPVLNKFPRDLGAE